ncbi:hypothetical protein GIB67_019681 [Kingdonia uniflora]|uniref:Uncharacterized protein n=1 Tax=Kingdonia uniflora TaxID=39325 RepID=A0A7J7MJR1_9MAGN|nr:hypothetical protein GIB67_019681 [Kingdonia uniflora]
MLEEAMMIITWFLRGTILNTPALGRCSYIKTIGYALGTCGNFKKDFTGSHLERLCWGATKAFVKADKQVFLDKLQVDNPEAKRWLDKEPVEYWCRSHFDFTAKYKQFFFLWLICKYCSEYHMVSSYVKTCSGSVLVISDPSLWDRTVNIEVLPPPLVRGVDRPRIVGRKSDDEEGEVDQELPTQPTVPTPRGRGGRGTNMRGRGNNQTGRSGSGITEAGRAALQLQKVEEATLKLNLPLFCRNMPLIFMQESATVVYAGKIYCLEKSEDTNEEKSEETDRDGDGDVEFDESDESSGPDDSNSDDDGNGGDDGNNGTSKGDGGDAKGDGGYGDVGPTTKRAKTCASGSSSVGSNTIIIN